MQIKELTEIREMRASLKAKIEAEGRKSLQKVFRSFFDECALHDDCRKNTELAFACNSDAPGKNVEAICWTQYTPHFNDGEACVFHVREFYWKLKSPDLSFSEESYQGDGFMEAPYGSRKERSKLAEACLEFERALKDDEIFLAVFGDHVKVVATREGFEVTEYEHD